MNTSDDQRVSDLLQRTNPVKPPEGPLDVQAESDLSRILGTRSSRPVARRLVPALAAAGVLATVAAGAVVVQTRAGHGGQPAVSGSAAPTGTTTKRATESPAKDSRPAPVQLRELADRVRLLPDERPTGPVLRNETRGWPPGAKRSESVWRYWVKDNVRYYWNEKGRWTYGGKLYWPDGLSANVKTLRAQLMEGHEVSVAYHTVSSLIDAQSQEEPQQPAVRAAILEVLAGLPGITATGPKTDPLGRQVVGFTADPQVKSSYRTLLIDPRTGEIVASESFAKASPVRKGEIPAGTSLGITTYSRTYQAAFPTRP